MAVFFKRILPNIVISVCALLMLVLAAAVFFSSVFRYGFDTGSVKLEDLINYTFSALAILSVLVAFYSNAHVRVDMFSELRSILYKPLSRVFSALPFIAIIILSLPAISFSWSVFEGSREPDGLGGLFIVKSLLPVSFGLIAVYLFLDKKDNH